MEEKEVIKHEPMKPLRYHDAAKTIADKYGIDLKDVPYTGPNYNITYDDVMKFVKDKGPDKPKTNKSNA